MSEDNQLGSLLIARGLLTPDQLDAALADQERTHRSLGRILIDKGLVTESGLVSTLAEQIGLEYVELDGHPVDPAAAGTVRESLARRYQALPIGWEDGRLVVAMADPSNVFALDDIRMITGAEVKMVVATRSAILAAIDAKHADAPPRGDDGDDVLELLARAVGDRASDLHLEPGEHDLRVRHRVDGVLHEVARTPRAAHARLVSRILDMAQMGAEGARVPREGRMSLSVAGREVEVRVTTLPTPFGEHVALRIGDRTPGPSTLDDLGLLPANLVRVQQACRRRSGMILVTGHNESGKSTTVHAMLAAIDRDSRSVVMVEDPIERAIAGVTQVQVDAGVGLTPVVALRSVLRSDPDVVGLSELRDRETAIRAAEAALEGCLVVSTLPTDTAARAPVRLVEMGVEPFVAASALACVVAQRMARRLCDACKEAYQPAPADLVAAGWRDEDGIEVPTLWRAGGCPSCGGTGYNGRLVLHEVLVVSEEVARLIADRRHSEDIEKVAVAQGMLTMRQVGWSHVLAGLTSLPELLRVAA